MNEYLVAAYSNKGKLIYIDFVEADTSIDAVYKLLDGKNLSKVTIIKVLQN
jgi:hypothetical protein